MDEELFNNLKTYGLTHEFDWFAFDKKGQIAIFTSVDSGIVPTQVWESYEAYGNTLNFFLNLQPKKNFQQLLDSNPGAEEDYKEYAKTGIFAYRYSSLDFGRTHDLFQLQAEPDIPLLSEKIKLKETYKKSIPVIDVVFGIDTQIANRELEKLLITPHKK